jgi:outer membrane protein assembly factor BamB
MRKKFVAVAFGVFLLYAILSVGQPRGSRYTGSVSPCRAGIDCSKFPAVASDAVLYYGSTTNIIALNVETGKPLWTYSMQKGWVASNLVTLGSRVFFASNTAGPCAPVYAIGTGTQKIEWSKDYGSCPIWSDGRRLYLQGGNGDGDGIIAVDPATGKELWHAEGETSRFVQTLVVRNGRIYTDDRVLDAKTGKTLLWWPKDSSISGITATDSVVVIGGYIGGRNGVLSAYNATTLEKEWQSTLLAGKDIVSAVAADKLVYVVGYTGSATSARDGVLQAFDANTGQPEWSYQIHSCCQNLDVLPVSVRENALFLVEPADAQSGSKLVALGPATGKPLWSFQSAATLQGPAYPHGWRVYVTDSQDKVIALDTATGRSAWAYQP